MVLQGDHVLSSEQLETFERDGFLVLRGVVSEDTRAPVVEAINRTVEQFARTWRDEGAISETYDDLPFERRWAALRAQVPPKFPVRWRKVLVCPGVYELWQRPEILGPVRSIIGDEVYAHGVWNCRPREPGTASTQKVDWHQDAHYYKAWNPSEGVLVSCWMPLVHVDEKSGCLQFIPGSHHGGLAERTRSANGLFTVPNTALKGVEPETVPAEPGDMILFSDLALHQALDNNADYVRWSIDIRFGEPTTPIIAKTPTGYFCYSASDPSRVESYETWAKRYDYDWDQLMEELETRGRFATGAGPDELTRSLGIVRAELDVI